MFATIFRYELRHWFTSISLYFYWSIFLALGFLIMGSQSGLIEGAPPNTNEVPLVNSPFAMFSSGNYLNSFWIFLLPIIVGMGLFRDFRSRTHYLLYSFPIPKSQYWLAKFSSSFLAVCFVLSGCGIGFVLGCYLPGAIPELVTPLEWSAYLQWYGLFLLPNALVMGFLVFVAVAWSRNIYLGFIVIILLLFIQSMAAMLPVDLDDLTLSALLDPMGKTAAFWMAEEWSIAEQNRALFPLTGILGQNRLLWLGLGFFIFGLGYSRFQMTHHGNMTWTWKNQKDKTSPASFSSVQRQLDRPQANLRFDLQGRWQQLWTLIQSDFRYLMTSPIFLIIVGVGILFVLFIFYQADSGFRSPSLPLTYRMLEIPGTFFGLIMNLLTFLFAGLLIQRGRMHQMNHLIDVNPVSDRALLASKFWALTLMQIVLLGVLFLGGIIYQVSQGYYQVELGHYAFELGVIRLANMIVWSMAALFVQTLFPNPYLGFFLLVCGAAGMAYLPDLGIEQAVFRYNQGPNFVFTYSDMDAYGRDLIPYLSYKLYWSLGGMVLLGLSWALWRRGLVFGAKERWQTMLSRLSGQASWFMLLFGIAFLSMGFGIYYESNILHTRYPQKQQRFLLAQSEKNYKQYEDRVQPRIVRNSIDLDLKPENGSLYSTGTYTLVNQSEEWIDSIFVHYAFEVATTFSLDRPYQTVHADTVIRFHILDLDQPLAPKDTVNLKFTIQSYASSMFKDRSPILENGSYFSSLLWPSLGYPGYELRDAGVRAKYGLPPLTGPKSPLDSLATRNSYRAQDADFMDFEITISTAPDQTAIAPGYLQKEWMENGRRYFHYASSQPVTKDFIVHSGRYEVKKEMWEGIPLEIYYHPGHDLNLDRIMRGMRAGLTFCSEAYGPYHHDQMRVVEVPRSKLRTAQSFANTIPFSEEEGFTFVPDFKQENGLDYPFELTAHEIAHQWWGHQVIPAATEGFLAITEGLSEYSLSKVVERELGPGAKKAFLDETRRKYFRGRKNDYQGEKPLLQNRGHRQAYLAYQKGTLVYNLLADYLGEDVFHGALQQFMRDYRLSGPPYPTVLTFREYIAAVTPDSLDYLLVDWLDEITFYDNQIGAAKVKEIGPEQYQLSAQLVVQKYRTDQTGKPQYQVDGRSLEAKHPMTNDSLESLPLRDYVEVVVYGQNAKEQEIVLTRKMIRFDEIVQELTLTLDSSPTRIAIDPELKLLDRKPENNSLDVVLN